MTIKELHEMTDNKLGIGIKYGGKEATLDRENIVDLMAYGDFIIDKLTVSTYPEIIAFIQMIPKRKEG